MNGLHTIDEVSFLSKLVDCIYHERMLLSLYKNATALFSFFSLLFWFLSRVWHPERGSHDFCASIPWSALVLVQAASLRFDQLFWPAVACSWVTGFPSLFFSVQILFLPLSRCPRLHWQLLKGPERPWLCFSVTTGNKTWSSAKAISLLTTCKCLNYLQDQP